MTNDDGGEYILSREIILLSTVLSSPPLPPFVLLLLFVGAASRTLTAPTNFGTEWELFKLVELTVFSEDRNIGIRNVKHFQNTFRYQLSIMGHFQRVSLACHQQLLPIRRGYSALSIANCMSSFLSPVTHWQVVSAVSLRATTDRCRRDASGHFTIHTILAPN